VLVRALRNGTSSVVERNPQKKDNMNTEGKRLQKELAGYLREKDKAALRLLRARIQVARVNRVQLLRGARQACRDARAELVARQKGERESFVQRQRGERIAERTACATGKETAKAKGREGEKQTRAELATARKLQREVARADKRNVTLRSTKRERSAEDDDAVRSNLPPDLRPVFDKVRRHIRATPKKSRTEAFLDWAEENPDEILAVQQEAADQELKQLLRQQREAGRTVRDARRYKLPPDELAKLLEAVPF